jgi:DNA-binding GntR family transcriptional regulator
MKSKEKKLQDSLSGKRLEDGKEVLEFEDEAVRKIAEKLKISPETAKHHIERALNAADKTNTIL